MKQEFTGTLTESGFNSNIYYLNEDCLNKILDDNFLDKRIKIIIEVLPEEFEEDSSVKIQVKLRTVVHNDGLCNEMNINPYCINEGANGDEFIDVPIKLAKEYGLI